MEGRWRSEWRGGGEVSGGGGEVSGGGGEVSGGEVEK